MYFTSILEDIFVWIDFVFPVQHIKELHYLSASNISNEIANFSAVPLYVMFYRLFQDFLFFLSSHHRVYNERCCDFLYLPWDSLSFLIKKGTSFKKLEIFKHFGNIFGNLEINSKYCKCIQIFPPILYFWYFRFWYPNYIHLKSFDKVSEKNFFFSLLHLVQFLLI